MLIKIILQNAIGTAVALAALGAFMVVIGAPGVGLWLLLLTMWVGWVIVSSILMAVLTLIDTFF